MKNISLLCSYFKRKWLDEPQILAPPFRPLTARTRHTTYIVAFPHPYSISANSFFPLFGTNSREDVCHLNLLKSRVDRYSPSYSHKLPFTVTLYLECPPGLVQGEPHSKSLAFVYVNVLITTHIYIFHRTDICMHMQLSYLSSEE